MINVQKKSLALFIIAGIVLSISNAMASVLPDSKIDPNLICINATNQAEKKHKIKKHLLSTISNVETGRWNEKENKMTTWPWTINADGKSYYYDTKIEAVRAVRKLKKDGAKSIDVGCMQINLTYHKDAFENLNDAFDPYKNVEYGAKFLKSLHSQTGGDWDKAATYYHSKTPIKGEKYKNKLDEIYETIKRHIDKDIKIAQKSSKEPKEIKMALNTKSNKIKHSHLSQRKKKSIDKKINNSANEWRLAKLEEYNNKKALDISN